MCHLNLISGLKLTNFRHKYLRFSNIFCQRSRSFHRHSCSLLKLLYTTHFVLQKRYYFSHNKTNIKGNFRRCDKMKYLKDYLVFFRCFTHGRTSTRRQQQRLKGQVNNLLIDLLYTIRLFNTLTIYYCTLFFNLLLHQ